MPNGALLDPGNRLLGGATGDFSLYGALPAATIGAARPPAADPSFLTVPLSAPAELATGAVPPADEPDFFGETALPLPAESLAVAPLGGALHAMQAPTASAIPTLAPQVVSPVGSGSVEPIIVDTALPLVAGAATVENQAPITGGVNATSLAAPVLNAAEAAPAAGLALAPAITALVTPALDAVPTTVGDVVTTVGSASNDAAAALIGGLAHDAVLPTVEPVVSAVAVALPDAKAAVDTAATAPAATALRQRQTRSPRLPRAPQSQPQPRQRSQAPQPLPPPTPLRPQSTRSPAPPRPEPISSASWPTTISAAPIPPAV